MSNFDFLKDDFFDLYELCLEAEENCYTKPRTSAFYSRLALEFCVALVYKFENIQTPYNSTVLNDFINNRDFKQLFQNQSQVDGLNIIRKFGNSAAHVLKNVIDNTTKTITLDRNIALNCLKGLFDFTLWIGYCYGSTLQTDDIKFDDKYIPKNISKLENANDIKVADNYVQDSINNIKVIPVKKHDIAVNNNNFSEADTRKLFIDTLLVKAGWNLDDENMFEYEVREIKSTSSGKGKIDYVLWGDNGIPLAIIEAKKAELNAKKENFKP